MFSLLLGEENAVCFAGEALFENLNFSFLASAKEYPLLRRYLTYDDKTIRSRQALFSYVESHGEMVTFFDRLSENVENMIDCLEAARAIGGSESSETLFYSFRELGFFIDAAEDICQTLKDCPVPQLAELYERAKDICAEDWFANAKLFAEGVAGSLRNIKSVTVGINLDAQLRPLEAGIVAFDEEPYVTNTLYDKMFAPQVKNRDMICIAPLGVREAKLDASELRAININLYRGLNDIMKGSLKKIRGILQNQFLAASGFLFDLAEELRFINICTRYMLEMKAKAQPLCFAETGAEQYEINELYDPNLARVLGNKDVVKNDAVFDEKGKIHLVAGVNSGGKSVYLRSVGIAQVLFQLGMPIPARKGSMTAFHEIMSLFSHKTGDKAGGRLENECREMAKLCEKATEHSMILLDEVFSSTNSYDASVLAKKIVEWFAKKGCSVIYTTHIHELVLQAETLLDGVDALSRVDVWSAEYQEEKATYRILRKPFCYESTAMQIFKKYGMESLA